MSAQPLIETKALTKQYPGVLALNAVDFDLHPGEVHVLFGENGAGKSTLISMLAGANTPSQGSVVLDGQKVKFDSVADAQKKGIYTVFQEFSLIPTLTVAQNIFLGWEPMKGPFIDHRTMRKRAYEMLLELGFDIDPNAVTSHLSRAQQQMVEITKAFHGDLKVLILDEPTASLTDKEVDHLFEFVNELKAKGVGIIYISHRIQEFSRIASRVTVLRDGAKIGTVNIAETNEDALVEMMTGRAIDEIYPKIEQGTGEILLTVEGLRTAGIHDAFFEVRAGEILGVAGLVGSGKSRLFRTVMGLTTRVHGTVKMRGKDISHAPTRNIIKEGIYYLSPDRKAEGLDLAKPSKDNLAINLVMGDKVGGNGQLVKWSEVNAEAATISDYVELHEGYRNKPVSQLSGGNQQKMIIAREVSNDPEVLIAAQPTRGLDVGAIEYVHKALVAQRNDGKAVLLISFELDEVINVSDRIAVIYEGKIVGIVNAQDADENQIGLLMAGGSA